MKNLAISFIERRGRATLSLFLIYLSVWTQWYWLWGVLILLWALNDMIVGQTWLSETIARRQNPVLYYLILATWLVFGFYFALYPFAYLLR